MTDDHPAVVDLYLAPPGTPLPANAVDPLHGEFVDAGAVRGPELLDEHGLGGMHNPFPITWVRLVPDVLATVRRRDPWSVVAHVADPDGFTVRAVLPFVVFGVVHGRTAYGKAYALRGAPPVRWHYAAAPQPIGAPA